MRKIIVQEYMSLDGFVSGENGELDFLPNDAADNAQHSIEKRQLSFIETLDTMVIGRNTYNMFSEYWPNARESVAAPLNSLKKYVCSTTLREAAWGTYERPSVISGHPWATLARMKQEAGKDIVIWGSISLVHSLCGSDIIDEYELYVCPSIIGKGRRLFPGECKFSGLKLLGSETFNGGYILLRYRLH